MAGEYMKTITHAEEGNTDGIDLRAAAVAGVMIGAIVSLAGLCQQHPVLSRMAEVYDVRPTLSAGQTLFIGLMLVAGSIWLYVWSMRAQAKRR
jgi:hypothetical protein